MMTSSASNRPTHMVSVIVAVSVYIRIIEANTTLRSTITGSY